MDIRDIIIATDIPMRSKFRRVYGKYIDLKEQLTDLQL